MKFQDSKDLVYILEYCLWFAVIELWYSFYLHVIELGFVVFSFFIFILDGNSL